MKTPRRIDSFQIPSPFPTPGYYFLSTRDTNLPTQLEKIQVRCHTSSESSGKNYTIISPHIFHRIEHGDIGLINQHGRLRVILSRKANHNTLLITEQCNNNCLFCSQPPQKNDDSFLLNLSLNALIDFNFSGTIGISGGEPLLYGTQLLNFIDKAYINSPNTQLHILSNGRLFNDIYFAHEVAFRAKENRLIFGIPIYASNASLHDKLVGTKGAFSETINGLINAGNLGIPLEIRIIPTQQNIHDLTQIIELISKTLSSVCQISIMNLEPAGWARKNWEQLYAPPEKYHKELLASADILDLLEIPTYLFNFPLCHLPSKLHNIAVKSISDWKNYFPQACASCALKETCGGYFISANKKKLDPPRPFK